MLDSNISNRVKAYDTVLYLMVGSSPRDWGMGSTFSFPFLSRIFRHRVVVAVRVSSKGQIEPFNPLQRIVIIIHSLELFTSALADGLSLEYE